MSHAGCPSPPAPREPWAAIFLRRIWASSSFLRHYDEAQILLKSQPQICAIGPDGGHRCVILPARARGQEIWKRSPQ
ncbi:MAG: hypothetical protein C0429_08840 [Sphingopyxis sp.]|nr:hypothetical protein [Sphingopyxis sp.]